MSKETTKKFLDETGLETFINYSPMKKGSAINSVVQNVVPEDDSAIPCALSKNSASFGIGSTSGLKGFEVIECDTTNNTYKIDGTIPKDFDDVEEKRYSIQLGSNYDLDGTVISIDATRSILTVEHARKKVESGENVIWFPDYPNIGNIDIGEGAFAEGLNTKAAHTGSHAEGRETIAAGKYSHAEGRETIATYASHAEGRKAEAIGQVSHAEGQSTKSIGDYSHAEGYQTEASGIYTHAEGQKTKAIGTAAHSEGAFNTAEGDYSHAEGTGSYAKGYGAHAEGTSGVSNSLDVTNITYGASGEYAHSENYRTTASGKHSHAEGHLTVAQGDYSHAGGRNTIAKEEAQTVIGTFNTDASNALFIIGNGLASNILSNAFEVHKNGQAIVGSNPTSPMAVATKDYVDTSIESIEVANTLNIENGAGTDSLKQKRSATVSKNVADGQSSFAQGIGTQATKTCAVALGSYTIAQHDMSLAAGTQTKTSAAYQTVVGIENEDNSSALFIVGNGVKANSNTGAQEKRSNAFTVLNDGRATVAAAPKYSIDVVNKGYLDTRIGDEKGTGYSILVVDALPDNSDDIQDNVIYLVKGTTK